jgi:two-component system sensor histidine kinase KdpD
MIDAQNDLAIIVKGKLKVFLGYAAGVGKTYQMLEEGRELLRRGQDVVVGYFEPHDRPDTIALLEGLEIVPRRIIEYRGARFEEMDRNAIVRRAPQVALIDEFPHTNVPGTERAKRWEDVFHLLDHGIDVLTTMNVQHLESLNDKVYQITGIRVRETIPDWVVQRASEVVMVDLTPRALLNRLDRGVVYRGEKAQRAKENFFRESTLVALREFALRETAFELESRHGVQENGADPIESSVVANGTATVAVARERVLVLLTADPSTASLIRRGRRVADYFHGDCVAIAVCPGDTLASFPPDQREALEQHMNFARNLHVDTQLLQGENVAEELVNFARQHAVTQIYMARPKTQMELPFTRNLVQRVARLARDMEVTIVAERGPKPA